jgi:hypothetical protein
MCAFVCDHGRNLRISACPAWMQPTGAVARCCRILHTILKCCCVTRCGCPQSLGAAVMLWFGWQPAVAQRCKTNVMSVAISSEQGINAVPGRYDVLLFFINLVRTLMTSTCTRMSRVSCIGNDNMRFAACMHAKPAIHQPFAFLPASMHLPNCSAETAFGQSAPTAAARAWQTAAPCDPRGPNTNHKNLPSPYGHAWQQAAAPRKLYARRSFRRRKYSEPYRPRQSCLAFRSP